MKTIEEKIIEKFAESDGQTKKIICRIIDEVSNGTDRNTIEEIVVEMMAVK